jgi:cytochrome c biogenesis protein CcmG/thiol:disulfide interchange protein DsbE
LLLAYCIASPGRVEAGSPGNVEQPAPAFSFRDLDGKTFKLSDYRGKPVLVDFWATWCAPCRASLPHLSDLQERYRQKGLVVVGLSLDDLDAHQVRRFTERLQLRFRIGMADEKVLDAYGPIRSIPTTFFIDKKGRVVRRVVGYIDAETTDSYAQELFGAP